MQVRSWLLAGVLVLLAPTAIAAAQDATFAAQDQDPEGIVLPGEEDSGAGSESGGGSESSGGSDEDTPSRDESPSGTGNDSGGDDEADRSAASRAERSGDDLPQTGSHVTPMVLLGLSLILAGVLLRERTVPRTRRW
jgi:LPXTG-motif cell wall-anchored protein